jgi:multidrug efflux pump subunit AcrB
MLKKSKKVTTSVKQVRDDNLLVKMTSFFFQKWRLTMLLWVFILGFGATTYTTLIKREGFPPIQFPLSLVQGTYFVDDIVKVDEDVAQPLYELLIDVEGVTEVQTVAGGNFFTAVVSFEDGTDPTVGSSNVEQALSDTDALPEQVTTSVLGIDPGSFLNEFDMLLSVYSTEPTTVAELQEVSDYIAKDFLNDPLITNTEVQAQLETGQNPTTGEEQTRQTSFNLVGLNDDELDFFQSVIVGIDRDVDQIDVIELSKLAKERIATIDLSQFGDQYEVVIGADFAESIETQISSLQSNLLTGLLAVAVVSLLLITWRASIITGLFMITVVAATVSVLYLVGYSLNTITLFALVLSLGLFVDDATIVVESIVASRSKKKKPIDAIRQAIRQIGAASFAGTFTTVLVFLPLAFLTGILGEFIRLMPITIIIALITSLVLSLTVIPVLAKFILLKNTELDRFTKANPIARLESYLGKKVGSLPRLLSTSRRTGIVTAVGMILLSLAFVVGGAVFAGKLSLNIFPPSKDSDQIGFVIDYPDGYTIEQAEVVASGVNDAITQEIGPLVTRVLYGNSSQPNARSADALVELTPFNERDEKSPEIIERLQLAINDNIPSDVGVRVLQLDSGPPVSEFPFQIQIIEENQTKAYALAAEIDEFIDGATIERANGTTALITKTQPPTTASVSRSDGERVVSVGGSFNADDTSGLLTAARSFVEDTFTAEYLSERGYAEDVLEFDFGQESENADSFASLAYAFPIALLLMYILLAAQFRSFLQPLLIFMAIPFTFFGVFAGLYLTDNALSFFVQVGLIGLIGIAVNNTILLTESANQEKRAGVRTIDAIANAVQKRFRPLVTTTLTTVVALLPLALSDPFWEALAYTIIFGLLSSTVLVVLSFPYFYLVSELLRKWFREYKIFKFTVLAVEGILITGAIAAILSALL